MALVAAVVSVHEEWLYNDVVGCYQSIPEST